jgi:hypothetical protein
MILIKLNEFDIRYVINMKKIVQLKRLAMMMILVSFIISCKKEPVVECPEAGTEVKLSYTGTFNGATIHPDSIYRNFQNYPIKIEKVNFFMSDIQFNELDTLKLSNPFLYRNNQDEAIRTFNHLLYDFGDFSSMSFNIGVSQPTNSSDPTTYSEGSHFSSYHSGDMHWSWNTGYIFLKIEGRYDTIPGSIDTPLNFAWHIGNDVNLESITFDQPFSIEANKLNTIHLKYDIAKVFVTGDDTVWVKEDPILHSTPSQIDVSKKVISNFSKSIEIQ